MVLRTIKGILAFLEVIMYITGIFSADVNVSYSAATYNPPEITAPMQIVDDGASDFVIVTAENPDVTTKTAVKELQTYIEKVSGAKIKAVTEKDVKPEDKAIILGKTNLENGVVKIDRANMAADGFMLYSNGKRLYIAGADSRGTLYGVYAFLEEYLGVRWFTPELEVVPEKTDIVIDSKINRLV